MVLLGKVDLFTGFRRMFYAVSQNETSFKDPSEVPEYINEASPFFFVCMLLELVISLYKQDHKYRMNDAFTSMSAGIFSRLPMLLVRSITVQGYMWVYQHWRLHELPWQSPWTWWLTFLAVDFGYYWFHRMAHEVNFMWAFHQTHHSSEDYNFSTALRQSMLQIYTSWVFYLPLALFIPPAIFLAHHELNILYQFWIHTQYIKTLGPLEYILNTPSHHRVHHGRNPYCIDKNYAGTLIIWDRLFGTFQAEGDEVAYGLTHPLGTFEAIQVQFAYSKYVLERMFSFPATSDKLRSLIYGPGWSPGKPRTGDIEDIPKIENPVQRYSVEIPRWLSVYVFVHFLLFSVGFQVLMRQKGELSQTSVFVFVFYSFLNLTAFGRLFDNSRSSKYVELLRCILFVAGEQVMCQLGCYGEPGVRPGIMYAFIACFALSSAVWLVKILKAGNTEKKASGSRKNGATKNGISKKRVKAS